MDILNDCSLQEQKLLGIISDIVIKKDSFTTGAIALLDLSEKVGLDSIHLTRRILLKLQEGKL